MSLGVLDITPLTALQSHLCSLYFSRMATPRAEEAVWLLSLFLPLSLCLTDFFLLYFLNMKNKNSIFFAGPCQLSLILYRVALMVATYKWKLGTSITKKRAFSTCFWEAQDTNVFLFNRVILRNFGESHELAVVWLDVPNWLQRFGKVTCNIHYCFCCTFSKFKADCVSMCLKSFSVCLIMARGWSLVQATSPFKHTSNPLFGGTTRHRFWVCVSLCETQAVGGGTLIQNEKLPTKCSMPQLGLTHGRAAEPGATGADPGSDLETPGSPQGWLHIMTTLCVSWNMLSSISSPSALRTQNSHCVIPNTLDGLNLCLRVKLYLVDS